MKVKKSTSRYVFPRCDDECALVIHCDVDHGYKYRSDHDYADARIYNPRCHSLTVSGVLLRVSPSYIMSVQFLIIMVLMMFLLSIMILLVITIVKSSTLRCASLLCQVHTIHCMIA